VKVFDECVTGEENSQNEKLREELRSWEKRTELYSCYFTCDCLLQLPLNIGIMEMSWILVYSVYIIETVRIKRQAW